ncbi:MAG: S8 family serine peptidase, partial [Dehalococcoidia bacterium]
DCIAGVVPRSTIMPFKDGDCIGPITTALAAGILYAAHNGAQIINLSVGLAGCAPAPSDVLDAVRVAQADGALVVAASGNDRLPCVGSPANAPGVLAVGSTAFNGSVRAPFSQWGPEIAVVAPGVGIEGTVPLGSFPPPATLYGTSDGTSFSTPMVAGLADLLLSQNSLLTPLLLRRLIQRGATPLPENGQPGWAGAGRIDLLASLRRVPAGFYGRVGAGASNTAGLPDGTPVVATIGTQVCGQGVTMSVAGGSAYAVFVQPDAAQPGCGAAGARVRFLVGGRDAGSAAWTAAAVPVDLAPGPGPASGTTVLRQLHAGWNLVAGIVGAPAEQVAAPIYTLQPGDSSYEVIPAGVPSEAVAGYWVFVPSDTTVSVPSSQSPDVSLSVPAGHFVLVGNSDTTRAVTVTGADAVYTFDPAAGSYALTVTLAPGQGAWAYSAAGGVVTLH